MQQFEVDYANIIKDILMTGATKETRNGLTKSVFGRSLVISNIDSHFPLIQGRKMYPRGILGELAAMLRRPTHIDDFKAWGCNYWDLWADETGELTVDYGNAWFDFDGFNQIADLKDKLANNPDDRRMLINSWRPNRLEDLSLPCCHYSYQFYVANNTISMIWTQRSVDMMIGLPSDIVFAAAWLIAIANEFGFKPGTIKMDLGDCHVYSEHVNGALTYVDRVLENGRIMQTCRYKLNADPGKDFCDFVPEDIKLGFYDSYEAIQFKLKA